MPSMRISTTTGGALHRPTPARAVRARTSAYRAAGGSVRSDGASLMSGRAPRVSPSLRGADLASVPGLVLERDPKPHAEVDELAVLDRHILAQDLRNAKIADGFGRSLDRVAGGCLPRFAADADNLGYAVDALRHAVSPVLVDCAVTAEPTGAHACAQPLPAPVLGRSTRFCAPRRSAAAPRSAPAGHQGIAAAQRLRAAAAACPA